METRKLIIVTTLFILLIFAFFYLLKNNRKKSLELGKINKERKQKLVEENEKLKKDNPEEYQNITIRKGPIGNSLWKMHSGKHGCQVKRTQSSPNNFY